MERELARNKIDDNFVGIITAHKNKFQKGLYCDTFYRKQDSVVECPRPFLDSNLSTTKVFRTNVRRSRSLNSNLQRKGVFQQISQKYDILSINHLLIEEQVCFAAAVRRMRSRKEHLKGLLGSLLFV